MPAPVLITCQSIAKGFGPKPLFRELSLTIHEGDHIGLVGPNGTGKSTLLKILAGLEIPDDGSCTRRRNLRVGYVPQHPLFAEGRSVANVIEAALGAATPLEPDVRARRAAVIAGQLGFDDPTALAETLSGGWRTRLAIAEALAGEPELLLLDEPTNHLDLDSRLWLEGFLAGAARAFVVVSHDRYFLQHVGRRMIDLDRVYAQGLLSVEGTYADLLEKRDAVLSTQASYEASLKNRVRREVEWLRRGAKARTRKAQSRIDAAHASIAELQAAQARAPSAAVGLELGGTGRKTKRLWWCEGLGKSYGERRIVEALDLLLTPGTRLGVVGANGSGKTTLLRLIVGELEPDSGSRHEASGLRIVYFDQKRARLDPNVSLKRALAPDGDAVVYRDSAVHVASWAKRFQFRAEQLETPVARLSGGERARVVMARLMLEPADLLVLDEPTNDLDIPTLEVLEESLLELAGALVLVTHDRHLLDRVTTEILALDGQGGLERFADYDQWQAARARPSSEKRDKPREAPPRPPPPRAKKLSYNEQREWDEMEERVLAAEAALATARARAEDPSIASDPAALTERLSTLGTAEAEVERLYGRWAELEAKRG